MDVESTIRWLSGAAEHMKNAQARNVMMEAARILGYQKKSLETVLGANAAMAEQCAKYTEAEKEGRLHILPCSIGDKVFIITTCEGMSPVLDGSLYEPDGSLGDATGYYCPYEQSCPHATQDWEGGCESYKDTLAVFEDTVEMIHLCEDGIVHIYPHNLCEVAEPSDFGNLVFFEKGEAEAKLKEIRDGKTDRSCMA